MAKKMDSDLVDNTEGLLHGQGTGGSLNDPGSQTSSPDKPADPAAEKIMANASNYFVRDANKEQGYDPEKGTI